MMEKHYPNKIEKTFRCGKALCLTCLILTLGVLPASLGASARNSGSVIKRTQPLPGCGGEVRERGTRAAAMGGAGVAVTEIAEGALRNPAMLIGAAGGGLLCWTPGRFGMSELGSVAAAWAQPFEGWTAAIDAQRYGFELYAEHRAGASAAIQLGDRLSAGLRLSVLHLGIKGYGSAALPVLDAGVGFSLSGELQVAAAAYAVNMPSPTEDERLPVQLVTGIAWRHEGLLLAVDLEKESRLDLGLRGGAEYRLLDVLALRCGISTLSRQWTAGFAVERGSFRVSYALALHSELGTTHSVGIGFQP